MVGKRKRDSDPEAVAHVRPSNKNSPLLNLPGEIRNKIYHHLNQSMNGDTVYGHLSDVYDIQFSPTTDLFIPAIMQVSHQTRVEFSTLWAPQHTLNIPSKRVMTLKQQEKFLDRIGEETLNQMPQVTMTSDVLAIEEQMSITHRCLSCNASVITDIHHNITIDGTYSKNATSRVITVGFPAVHGPLDLDQQLLIGSYISKIILSVQLTPSILLAIVNHVRTWRTHKLERLRFVHGNQCKFELQLTEDAHSRVLKAVELDTQTGQVIRGTEVELWTMDAITT